MNQSNNRNKFNTQVRTMYVIISPVRNEEKYIERTIQSVISQTVKPAEWIIVDDGSNDRTREIAKSYSDKYNWIRIIQKEDRGFRKRGAAVVQTFYFGYKQIRTKNYEFVCKIDGDVSFNSDYFEKLFEKFRENPKLGIACGVISNINKKIFNITWKNSLNFFPSGALKTYRKKCFDEIGGLKEILDWDTVDVLKAQMLRWETQSFKELGFNHYREMGALEKGLDNEIQWGESKYFLGYHPLYIFASGIMRMLIKPYFIGGLAIIYGYFKSYFLKKEQIEDKEMIRYIRKQQLLRFKKTII